jgi:hypothetical protein
MARLIFHCKWLQLTANERSAPLATAAGKGKPRRARTSLARLPAAGMAVVNIARQPRDPYRIDCAQTLVPQQRPVGNVELADGVKSLEKSPVPLRALSASRRPRNISRRDAPRSHPRSAAAELTRSSAANSQAKADRRATWAAGPKAKEV